MKRLSLFVLVAVILALLAGVALAKGEYRTQFQEAYPAAKGSALDSCNLCHGSGFALNKYGQDFGAVGRDFTAIEGKDSDGDGATNLAEIKALTLPGDPTSKPAPAPASPARPATPGTQRPTPAPSPTALSELAAKGIVKGVRNGDLGANARITRAQFATLILRIANLPEIAPAFSSIRCTSRTAWQSHFSGITLQVKPQYLPFVAGQH